MKTNRWQMGVNILLSVVLLAVAGFTWQLNSRHNQLSRELTQDLATTKGDLATTKGDLATAKGDLATTKGDLASTRDRLQAADAALKQDISRQGTALSADIEAARTRLQEVRTQLEAADTTLKQEISRQGTTLSADIEAARTQLQALQGQASEMSSQIARALIDVVLLYANVKDSIVEVWAWDGQYWWQGSGFLYGSEKRYIITAYHMVAGAEVIKVRTVSGVDITASPILVATNYRKDLAVLRLNEPLNATPLTLGDSSKVAVGEPVLLVGSPLGERGSATAGIVSGLNREVEYDGYFVADMIQFDAASNPGSSGSPLINAKGEVIGLLTAGVDIFYGYGMSYAVPASALKELVSILPQ